MRCLSLIILLSMLLQAEINPLFNVVKTKPVFKISQRYVAYIGEMGKSSPIIVNRKNEKQERPYDLSNYRRVDVYEDNGSFMIPTGNFKIKTYLTPKDYKTIRQVKEIFGFSTCDTYNRETYSCFTHDIRKQKDIIINRFKLERLQTVEINIDYIYIFK